MAKKGLPAQAKAGRSSRRGGGDVVSNGTVAAVTVAGVACICAWLALGNSLSSPGESEESQASACDDADTNCAEWAAMGECAKNEAYMHTSCRRSCGLCAGAQVPPQARAARTVDRRHMCSRAEDAEPTLVPGQLPRVFQEAVTQYPQYKPTVLSTEPWIVQFDNLFTETEAERLFALGSKSLARSRSVAGLDEKGNFVLNTNNVRTSANSWCSPADCDNDAMVSGLTRRIADITQSNPKSFELYQVLQYEPGQYYQTHHDWVDAHTEFPFGPRVYTFFLYLSEVAEGGGTHFPRLNLTVQPKLGRAVWWPSVQPDSPDKRDDLTEHEAQPVVRGIKQAANVWIHLYDFMTPYSKGCAP